MTSYAFKYLNPNEMVYVIKRRNSTFPYKHPLYSEPYNKGDIRNAIIAYKDHSLCASKTKEIKASLDDIYIEKIALIDLEGNCAELQMPLNVVLNEYCDLSDRKEYKEIFYFENKEDGEYTTKKLYTK
jgi:hypothetical protein